MPDQPRLTPDSQLHCPHCRAWHPVITIHTEGTAYTIAMRYWLCRGQRFYAGQDGGTSRHVLRSRYGRLVSRPAT
jgi:hypothetical protein